MIAIDETPAGGASQRSRHGHGQGTSGTTLAGIALSMGLLGMLALTTAPVLELLHRGLSPVPLLDRLDSMRDALEEMKRSARIAERVVLPSPRMEGVPESSRSDTLYLVLNGQLILYQIQESSLLEIRLGAAGARTQRVLAAGLEIMGVESLGGERPRLRLALGSDTCLLIDQTPLLNTVPPPHVGGAGHGF